MSHFAEGGKIGTIPSVSSASYINKMSHYCGTCYFNPAKRAGFNAYPFNSIHWNFFDRHEKKVAKNPPVGMMYKLWQKMKPEARTELLKQTATYLENINQL